METYINKKFYVPGIEEFHIGFEYEQFSHLNGRWESRILDYSRFMSILDEEICDWSEHHIRTKYLDKEDIENLGFEETSTRQYIIDACGDLPYWTHAVIDFRWKDDISIIGKRGQEVGILFRGKIKNKSELKKLLKQLCITK